MVLTKYNKVNPLTAVFLALGIAIISDHSQVKAATLSIFSENITISTPINSTQFNQGENQQSISIPATLTGSVTLRVTFEESDPVGVYKAQVTESFLHGSSGSTLSDEILEFIRVQSDAVSTKIDHPNVKNPLGANFTTDPNVGDISQFTTKYDYNIFAVSAPPEATFTGDVSIPTKSVSFTVKRVPEPLTILGSGLALGFGAYFKKEYSRKQKKTKAKA